MHSFAANGRDMIQVKVTSNHLKLLKDRVKEMCQTSPGLKEDYTLQGKVGEYAFAYAVNALFHFFNLDRRLELNLDNYIYGGDGGGDFFVGNHTIDVKYRDDAPDRGLYLDKSFIERSNDHNILVHTTNCINIKVSDLRTYQGQTMLVALNGWTTVGDFAVNAIEADKAAGRWRMDQGFQPIKALLCMLLKDQQAFERNLKEV